jgi:hypothetical protein
MLMSAIVFITIGWLFSRMFLFEHMLEWIIAVTDMTEKVPFQFAVSTQLLYFVRNLTDCFLNE